MELTRRSFVAGTAAAGVAAALGSTAIAQASESAPAEGGMQDGLWIGRAMGHRNYLTVQIAVSNGEITNMSVWRCDDTPGIGTTAAPIMMARIAEDQNLDVDVVSSATMTSFAVKNALEAAIEAAGGDPSAYHKGRPETVQGEDRHETADVVVVGAGTAGLVAAVRLLEAGKKVVVVEQLDIAGGSGKMTYSGVVSVNSELQQQASQGRFEEADPTYFSLDAKLDLLKSYNTPENNRFDGALPYQEAMYSNSGALVDWMHSIGVGFMTIGATPMFPHEAILAPGVYMGGCGAAMNYLADRIGALGGELLYGTEMTELVQAEDGTVTGIVAQAKDGSTVTVDAAAVCLCTGGFAANQEMVAEYYPQYGEFVFNCCKGSTGKGLQLAVEAGAYTECMGRTLGAFNSTTPDAAGTRFELAFIHSFAPGLMVNDSGSEFGEGNMSHAFMGKAICNPDNGGRFYHVTDHAGAIKLAKNDAWGGCTDYDCLFDRGDIVHFDTVAEAAEALNLPNLETAVAEHNAVALTGETDATCSGVGSSKLTTHGTLGFSARTAATACATALAPASSQSAPAKNPSRHTGPSAAAAMAATRAPDVGATIDTRSTPFAAKTPKNSSFSSKGTSGRTTASTPTSAQRLAKRSAP